MARNDGPVTASASLDMRGPAAAYQVPLAGGQSERISRIEVATSYPAVGSDASPTHRVTIDLGKAGTHVFESNRPGARLDTQLLASDPNRFISEAAQRGFTHHAPGASRLAAGAVRGAGTAAAVAGLAVVALGGEAHASTGLDASTAMGVVADAATLGAGGAAFVASRTQGAAGLMAQAGGVLARVAGPLGVAATMVAGMDAVGDVTREERARVQTTLGAAQGQLREMVAQGIFADHPHLEAAVARMGQQLERGGASAVLLNQFRQLERQVDAQIAQDPALAARLGAARGETRVDVTAAVGANPGAGAVLPRAALEQSQAPAAEADPLVAAAQRGRAFGPEFAAPAPG